MTMFTPAVAADPPQQPAHEQLTPWEMSYATDAPGVMSAQCLLLAPAGKDGFITSRDGHFYAGDSNRRLRFWGVNICFTGAFPTHEQADTVANRLAHFGVSAVRFHHMDRDPWPQGIFADRTLETLSGEALDRLDYFIFALKSQGIYTNLNLHVSRSWARAHKWENADKLPIFDKMVDLFHPELIEAQKKYARDLLTHQNPYTKTRYVDEPAVAMVEITNEDTFFTYGGEPRAKNLPEPYKTQLAQLFNQWKSENHRTSSTDADWYEFLMSVEEKFFTQMHQFLKQDLGVKCPIAGTIVLGPCGWRAQAKMDFIDVHTYWDHPTFPHKQWDMNDWQITNKPMVDHPANSFIRWSAARLRGKPFTMTEANSNSPNEWQACYIPMLATYAAVQDWDAVFLFDYTGSDQFQRDHIGGFFEVEGNPLQITAMPIAPRIFLSGAVAPAPDEVLADVNASELSKTGSQFYSDLPALARKIEDLDDDTMLHARIYSDLAPRAASQPRTRATDSRINWTTTGPGTYTGRFLFRDEHAAVFAGFANDQPIDLGPLTITKLQSPYAVLAVVPADPAQTLANADRLLLLALGRAANTDMQWDADRRSVAGHWGKAPVLIEPVTPTIKFKSGNYETVPLNPAGAPGNQTATLSYQINKK
jgi:hypothetical protein